VDNLKKYKPMESISKMYADLLDKERVRSNQAMSAAARMMGMMEYLYKTEYTDGNHAKSVLIAELLIKAFDGNTFSDVIVPWLEDANAHIQKVKSENQTK